MSMLRRFGDIMSANINALLDKCEDPAKMVDQLMRNLNDDLNSIKAETASVMADEARAKRELDSCKQEIEKMFEYAGKAVAAGNDNDARVFLGKRLQLTQKLDRLEQKYNIAKYNADKMKEMHDKVTSQISELNERRSEIKAKMATAKLQEKINSIGNSVNSSTANMDSFARMEEKANRMLDEANARAELNSKPSNTVEDLMSKYNSTPSSDIDDELAALKGEANNGDDSDIDKMLDELKGN